MTNKNGDGTPSPRIELYVRSLSPTDIRETQEQVIEQLTSLKTDGHIEEFEVVVTGTCVCPSSITAETAVGQRLLDRYETVEDWATEHDRELVGFEHREAKSTFLETQLSGISFPRMLLVEVRDGAVHHVAPSKNGTETTSVQDRLETY